MNWSIFSSKKNKNLEKIRLENLKWEFALQVSNIGIWDYNTVTNTTYFSEESAKIVGLTQVELNESSDSWVNLLHPEDKEKCYSKFTNLLNGEKSFYENISRVKHIDGSYRWILEKGKTIEYTKKGLAKRIIGTHIDITETRKKENQISESVALITKQNKKLRNFAHIAAHNLKEHSGNFESLLELYKDTDNVDEKWSLIDNLQTVSETLKSTIDNLRQVIAVDSVNTEDLEPIKLKVFTSEISNKLILNIEHTNAIIKNNIDENIVLSFNKLYLESIIQNLISNAIKYAHPDRNPEIEISSSEVENSIFVTIKDNGLGIDLKQFGNSIFGLYNTFHKNKDAEGVGLYITKNQIESLGGAISVESEVNVGSKFILEFPKKQVI